jgi:hypothetical protein
MTSHVAWIVLAALLAAAVGHAEPAPATGDTVENQALTHLDRGVAAYRAGDYGRAHAELLAASQLAPDRPNPYRWLALTEAALGDCDGALINIESFLSRVAADDPRVGELRALRERCLRTVRANAAHANEPRANEPRANEAGAAGSAAPPLAPPPLAGSALTRSAPAAPAPTAPPADPPMVRRWWFWTVVGAVAITAAGAGYALSHGSSSQLPPVICDPVGCHR